MNVKFIIDITQKISEPLKKTHADIKRITDQIKQNNSVVLEANKNIVAASIKRRQYLKEEVQDLKELKQRRKSAYSVGEIDEYNKRINETISRIRTLRSVDKGMFSGLTSRIGLMAAGAFSVYQGFNFVKSSIAAYEEEAKADAQVKASLESTGGVSGKNFAEISAEASRLQSKTLFGDEAIKSAQSVLLTFKQVRGEIFDKATPAILDLATKMKTDLNSATVQVGKALEDPITGMLNLRRSGVQFSDEQEANIKKLVEAGKLQEAQMIILNELQAQFGGSAEAAAKAGLGPWQQLGNLWGDLKEKIGGIMLSIGKGLLPVLRGMVDWLSRTIDYIRRNSEAFKTVAKIVTIAGVALGSYMLWVKLLPIRLAVLSAAKVVYGLVTGAMTIKVIAANIAMKALNLTMLMSPWGLAIAGIAAVATGIMLLSKNTSKQAKIYEAVKKTSQDYYNNEIVGLDLIFAKLERTNIKSKERNSLIEELKEKYPFVNEEIEKEIRNTDNLSIAKEKLRQQILKNAEIEGKKAVIQDLYREEAELQRDMAKRSEEYIVTNVFDFLKRTIATNFALHSFAIKDLLKQKGVVQNIREKLIGEVAELQLKNGDINFNPEKKIENYENTITGGEGIKNINISIANLVENITVSAQTMERGAEDFANKVKEVLLNAVNDANYQMG